MQTDMQRKITQILAKRPSLATLMKFAFIFIVASLVVLLVISIYSRGQRRDVRKRNGEILHSIARFKADQIAFWREERLADGQTVFNTAHLAVAIQRWLQGGGRAEGRNEILGRLEASKASKAYEEVELLDEQGEVCLSTKAGTHSLDPLTRALFSDAVQRREVILGDLYYCTFCNRIVIDMIVPLINRSAQDTPVVGAMLFRINPHSFLFPLVRSWPTVSRTAEAFLIRREADSVLFLTELRHRRKAELSLRIPLTQRDRPAVMAVMGQAEIVSGRDYRNEEVLAAVTRIPDSPWLIVAKIDTAEIYAPLRLRVRLMGLSLVGLLAALGALLGLVFNLRQKQYYQKLYAIELERKALTKHFEYLVRYANDIIILATRQGRIVEVNDRAISTFGYDREAFLQHHLKDLFVAGGPEYEDKVIAEGFTEKGTIWNASCQRRDGFVFPAEVSGRLIDIEGMGFFQGIIRDLSERREVEQVIMEKSARLDHLFNNIPLATQMCDANGRMLQVNPATVQLFGYSPREMVGCHMDELIIPLDMQSEAKEYTQKARQGETLLFEAKRRRKDGTLIDVFVMVFPIFLQNRRIGIFSVYQDISATKESSAKLAQNLRKLQNAVLETIQALARVVENRDPYTANHQKRVAELSLAIAKEMALGEDVVEGLRVAALVHDIGKISIPAEILSKPTKLNDIEFSLIRLHSQAGYDILKDIDFPWPVARIVLEHHERLNGSGYPRRLKGGETLLESRILSVADVVEAMFSHRPYRPARGLDKALEEISANRSVLYDAEVVEACLHTFRDGRFLFSDPASSPKE